VLSSCSEFTTAKTDGIHNAKGSSSSMFVSKSASTKSPDGFRPAPVSEIAVKKSSNLPKDKHGMPSYSHKERSRLVRTTAYSHMENEVGAPWKKNALGTYLKYGNVRSAAADWSKYPVGTKFKIKGLPHTYIVDDYGSALVGTNTIDIYHPTLTSMRKWGTRKAEITVIQWGDWDRTLNVLKGRTAYAHTRKMYYAAKAKVASGNVAKN
ncbi:3D domain-containing protein, partial [Akkermansiaceae bacterium]|nr:3D domain-containing protein [Akkermansiaceae bacterium]